MATGQLVLSEPLCYIVNKFGICQLKTLKTTMFDFYSIEEISAAKFQLMQDIEKMQLTVKGPRIPQRRDGDNRLAREIDDIVILLTFLDENKLLNGLPRYVSANPEFYPSTRLCEGDLKFLFTYMERMERQIQSFDVQLSAIMQEVHTLQWTQTRPVQAVGGGAIPFSATFQQPVQQPVHSQKQQQQPSFADTLMSNVQSRAVNKPATQAQQQKQQQSTGARPSTAYTSDVHDAGKSSGSKQQLQSHSSQPDWARMSHSQAESTDDEQPFTVFQSRSQQRKKRRLSKLMEANDEQDRTRGRTQRPRRNRKPLVVGSLKSVPVNADTASGSAVVPTHLGAITAAKPFTRKAVFCVDNVNPSCESEHLVTFVQSLDVTVITCHDTKPRRRKNETISDKDVNDDRRAFRLCIKAEDREKLLNPDSWPEHICISEWFFKSKDRHADTDTDADQRSTGGDHGQEDGMDDTIVGDGYATAGVAQN